VAAITASNFVVTKVSFLFTDKKKTVRSIVYFQYSVLLCTGYVKDKMSFSPVTSLQPLKVTVALKEDSLYKHGMAGWMHVEMQAQSK
jgi:hypothetical protein